jgi:DNA-binding NarL/FixJ family response regulator
MPTAAEAVAGSGPLSQFGRAMKQLSVRLILAGSPQAKGRVERRHGVFQDRLVKALRRKKIQSLQAATRATSEQNETINKLIAEGKRVTQIARAVGLSRQTVYKYL